jgi:hypothetical protein
MKLSKIKAHIKGKEICIILNDHASQWLGTMGAVWAVGNIRITEDAIAPLMDLKEKEQEKIKIITREKDGDPLDPVQFIGQLKPAWMKALVGGTEYFFFEDEGNNEMYALDYAYVKAAVGSDEYREYVLAKNGCDRPLIIVNDGMMPVAIIEPESKVTMEILQKEMRRIGFMRNGKTDGNAWTDEAAETEQTEMEEK